MNRLKSTLICLVSFACLSSTSNAQESINTSGGDGLGDGSFSYSYGIVVYTSAESTLDDATVIQGVQIPSLLFTPPMISLSPCPADINGDGAVDILDFLELNSAFNTFCNGCPADINGDGKVDILDFLELNSAFGTTCEESIAGTTVPQITVGLSPGLEAALSRIDASETHPELTKKINELRSSLQVGLFPNPNNGEQIKLDIFRSGAEEDKAELRVMNAIGQLVMSRTIAIHGEESRVSVNFDRSLESGLYFLTLDLNGESKALRFIVE
jgi:hypothetical protein